jgi:hypothetical protein
VICERCQTAFATKRRTAKFCSPNCARANARSVYETKMKATEIERFWAKVARKDPTDCWEWTRAKLPKGYGQCNWRGQRMQTHRLAYILSSSQDIPAERMVLHTCDNPPCCNPRHLWLGTAKDNSADMVSKGRQHIPICPTHCPQGHEYSEGNTLWLRKIGQTRHSPRCKTCQRAYDQKTKEARLANQRARRLAKKNEQRVGL